MNTQDNERAMKLLLADYLESYALNHSQDVNTWLAGELQRHLPDKSQPEINNITDGILTALNIQDEKAKSLQAAFTQGMSKEKWFTGEIRVITSALNLNESGQSDFVKELSDSVSKTGSELSGLITDSKPEIKSLSRLEDIARQIGNNALMREKITDDIILASEHSEHETNSQVQRVIHEELASGETLGLKAAVAGAGYTAAERGLIELHEDCRPAQCASIAQTVIEKARIAGGFAKLALREGVNLLERLAVSNIIGFLVAALGTRAVTSLAYSVCVAMLGSVTGAGVAAVTAIITPEVLYSVGQKLGDEAMSHFEREKPVIVNKIADFLKHGAEVAVDKVKNAAKSVLKIFR